MKKGYHTLKVFLTITALTVLGLVSANSVKASNITGYTLYTDIVASINDYSIASFNIDGYTAVVAEDLANYGFDVEWNPNERAVYITRGAYNTVASTYVAPIVSESLVGKKAYNILSTDIKAYINGNLVTSYNIGGRTIVYFDDLGVFGDITYSEFYRILELDISDGLQYKLGNPIDNDLYFTRSDFVYGSDLLSFFFEAVNNTNKTIKYITIPFFMKNRVYDPVYDSFGDSYYIKRLMGPVNPGCEIANPDSSSYSCDVYGVELCEYIEVPFVGVEYMDDTSEVIYYWDIGQERTEKYSL